MRATEKQSIEDVSKAWLTAITFLSQDFGDIYIYISLPANGKTVAGLAASLLPPFSCAKPSLAHHFTGVRKGQLQLQKVSEHSWFTKGMRKARSLDASERIKR